MENNYEAVIDDFFDKFNLDEYDNLDDIMESEEFKKQLANLKQPADMEYNLDYLKVLHADESTEEERRESIDNLVRANVNLVYKEVAKFACFATSSYDEDDMIQEGMQGLIVAAKRFDASKECQFSTYAVCWIKQKITRALYDLGNTIRIPVHMHEKLNKYNRYQKDFRRHNGRKATDEEAMIDLGFNVNDIRNVKYCNKITHPTSLSNPVGDDQSSTIIEFIEDYRYKGPEEVAEENSLMDELDNIIETSLNEREQKVIYARFGLHCARIYTLEEIGQEFDVTRERIRQIENKALRKLHSIKNIEKLEDYLYA